MRITEGKLEEIADIIIGINDVCDVTIPISVLGEICSILSFNRAYSTICIGFFINSTLGASEVKLAASNESDKV